MISSESRVLRTHGSIWKRDHGSRTEARRESNGTATGPYRRRASSRLYPKISLNTRCSISISENLSINGQTRSSDQLGIWSYNINP